MIQHLSGIIKHTTFRFLHNLSQRQILKPTVGQQLVEVVDICFQMLPMVETQSFLTDNSTQCFVWQRRHCELSIYRHHIFHSPIFLISLTGCKDTHFFSFGKNYSKKNGAATHDCPSSH